MNPNIEFQWKNFVESYLQKAPKGDVWSQTITQLDLQKISDGVAHFVCPNTGVKTVALNKQAQLVTIVSAITQVPVFSIYCEVMKGQRSERQKKSDNLPPLLKYQPTLDDVVQQVGLNAKYSFDNFAVSSCNNVAFAAAQVVAGQVGRVYNPLFIWGGVGVGKTHLVQATARRILQLNPHAKVVFCPGDRFTNEIIDAIRSRSTDRFRQKYRRLDVLAVDDIQFISGKQAVQEEFFHTFNDVVSRGGQVLLISDRPPQQIPDIEDRLRSRFAGGLIIDISPPDFELRTAIVLIKAKERGVDVEMEAAKVIAQHAADNRALEGILLSCYAKVVAQNTGEFAPVLTKADVERHLRAQSAQEQLAAERLPTPDMVMEVVCSYYKIKPIHLKQANRTEDISRARHVLMYLLREKLGLNYETIAHTIKRKDHTTIIHGVSKIKQTIIHNQYVRGDIVTICQNLNLPTDLS